MQQHPDNDEQPFHLNKEDSAKTYSSDKHQTAEQNIEANNNLNMNTDTIPSGNAINLEHAKTSALPAVPTENVNTDNETTPPGDVQQLEHAKSSALPAVPTKDSIVNVTDAHFLAVPTNTSKLDSTITTANNTTPSENMKNTSLSAVQD